MKTTLKSIILALIIVTTASLQAGYDATIEKALNLAATNPKVGCNIVGIPGRTLSLALSPENQALACVICGDEWQTSGKHPKARETVCGNGPLGQKQKALVEKAVNAAAAAPDKGCPVLGKMGRGLRVLSKDAKLTACATCGERWAKHPNAKASVCTAEILAELNPVESEDLPSAEEVQAEIAQEKNDPEAELSDLPSYEEVEAADKAARRR